MTLRIVQCDGTLFSFCNIITRQSSGKISSLEKVKEERNLFVVAEFVETISLSKEPSEYVIALFKEVLPTLEYGQQFKAIILESFLIQLETELEVPPHIGDIFAFFEPHIFPNPAFERDYLCSGSSLHPKYLLQTGHEPAASMWYTTKQTRHNMPLNNTAMLTEDRIGDLQTGGRNEVINMEINKCDTISNVQDMEIDKPDLELSLCARADHLSFQIDAFLIKVFPDPTVNPFNLVSGYCINGCNKMYLHSQALWKHANKTALCPRCKTYPGLERELQLVFVMKLRVLYVPGGSTDGKNITILASQREAEKFLECSVSEYLTSPAIRERALKILNNLVCLKRKRDSLPIPCMKLTVSIIENLVCLVDVKMQVETTPLWELPFCNTKRLQQLT